MSVAPNPLFDAWRALRSGFAPLFLEPVMESALTHLSGALRPGARVLDLGSGEGHVAAAVRACGGATIGLDLDPLVLAGGRRRFPGGANVAADAARLPLASASVDAIFCFSVLQYADRDAALAEMRRVLRPRGRVVVVENLAGSPVALAYRAWRALARIRYPERLTPRRHLAWGERGRLQAHFPGAEFEAWHLVSTALLAVPAVYNANGAEPAGSPVRACLDATGRLDRRLLAMAPWLRHGAWMLLMKG